MTAIACKLMKISLGQTLDLFEIEVTVLADVVGFSPSKSGRTLFLASPRGRGTTLITC